MGYQVQSPFEVFFGNDGKPLEIGFLYVGAPQQNPKTNPIPVFWDEAATQPADQPLKICGGYIVRSGTPSRVFMVSDDYSISLYDKRGSLIYYEASVLSILNFRQELAAPGGSAMIGYLPAGTGAVPTTVQNKLREFGSVFDYGAVGDGVADDSSAVTKAIAACKTLYWGDSSHVFRITSKLEFNIASQQHWGAGALRFDGTSTTRLADVTANDVFFYGLTFDGNEKQPKSSLVYVASSVNKPRFHKCTFKDITGTEYGTTVLNQTYALLISPYAVTDFEVVECTFKDLLKYNNGAYAAPTVGYGFIGGICFLDDTLAVPVAAQPTPTRGRIQSCNFKNIQTILAAGLSAEDQAELNDADAIRTYGEPGGAEQLLVHVSDCIFRDVSKRAFKFRAAGSIARDCEIYAADMQYGMVAPIDVTSNSAIENIRIYASSSKPVQTGVAWSVGPDTTQRETLVQGIFVSHCISGVSFFSNPANAPLRNLTLRDVFINQAASYGIGQSTPLPSTMENIVLENIQIYGSGDGCRGVAIVGGMDVKAGVKAKNVYLSNASFEVEGVNNEIDNVTLEVTSNAYAGGSATSYLFRIGASGYGGYQKVSNVFINAWNLDSGFLSATRTALGIIIGDNATYSNIRIKVPDGLSQSYPHCEFWGSDWSIDGYKYDGPGYTFIGVSAAAVRWSVANAVRLGSGASSSEFFYSNNAGTSTGMFDGVTDFRPTTDYTINLSGGTDFIVYNVASKTSNPTIVQHGGLAITANVNAF